MSTQGAWRLDPFARVVRFVGDFPEPSDDELRDYGYEIPERRPIDHGTYAGYRQHLRRKEETCAPCRAAMTADSNRRRAAKKANQTNTHLKEAS